MKKLCVIIILSIMLPFIVSGCSNNGVAKQSEKKKVELTVSAAASLQDALNTIKVSFEKDYPNIKVNNNFGASGTLEQQILQGAPVDLFFSAAEDKFDNLVSKGLIEKKNSFNLVKNELVLIVPNNSKRDIQSFKNLNKAIKIAMGTPETVPAGEYGKQTLMNLKLWDVMKGKVVYGKDVRQVLTYVETGNVDAGIVYKTDALISNKVKIVDTAADSMHDPIVYPIGIIKTSAHAKEAKTFYDYLQSGKAMKVLENYGFAGIDK